MNCTTSRTPSKISEHDTSSKYCSGENLISKMEDLSSPTDDESISGKSVREVDYYFNPTELFRWINYRRWDGARARILSHPEECSTWVVSRHSADGRILWRHLPLHLVSMQSGSPPSCDDGNKGKSGQNKNAEASTQQRQIEGLIDVLLEAYPHAASCPDDQGMLPLHLCVTNNLVPNERVLNLLLMINPSGVEKKDKYGRTPLDLLEENTSGKNEGAYRAMTRAQRMSKRLATVIRKENSKAVEEVKKWAENERTASKRIIMRLEEELQRLNGDLQKYQGESSNEKNRGKDLELQIDLLQGKVDELDMDVEQVRKERDDLVKTNEQLTKNILEHENSVDEVKRNASLQKEEQAKTISNLRSEVNTARTMAEAMESQLRARFTNEEFLTNEVSELTNKIEHINNKYQQDTKRLQHELEASQQENTILKKNVQDFAAKLFTMQTRMTEMNKHVENVVNSHGALNNEHDRMMDTAIRYESELIRCAQAEREIIQSSIRKQKEAFEAAMNHQTQALEKAKERESKLIEMAKVEKSRGTEVITQMRQDFREMRKLATEQELKIQQDSMTLTRHRKGRDHLVDSSSINNAVSYIPSQVSIESLKNNLSYHKDISIADDVISLSRGNTETKEVKRTESKSSLSSIKSTHNNNCKDTIESSPFGTSSISCNMQSSAQKEFSPLRPVLERKSLIYDQAPSVEPETKVNHTNKQFFLNPDSRLPSVPSYSSSSSVESVTPRARPSPSRRGQLIHLIEDRAERDEVKREKNQSAMRHPSFGSSGMQREVNLISTRPTHEISKTRPSQQMKVPKAPQIQLSSYNQMYNNSSDTSTSSAYSGAVTGKYGHYNKGGHENDRNYMLSSKYADDDSVSSFNMRYGIERISTIDERRSEEDSRAGHHMNSDDSGIDPLL